MKRIFTVLMMIIMTAAASALAQSEDAYNTGGKSTQSSGDEGAPAGLLDPSRFTVNHAMSFYAGGSQVSNMKSQSVYSTMFQYSFNAPVKLKLNFDMPIHSTFNPYNNFTTDNLASLDYFRNMPMDASVEWQPTQNFMLRVSVIKQPEYSYFNYGLYRSDRFYRGW